MPFGKAISLMPSSQSKLLINSLILLYYTFNNPFLKTLLGSSLQRKRCHMSHFVADGRWHQMHWSRRMSGRKMHTLLWNTRFAGQTYSRLVQKYIKFKKSCSLLANNPIFWSKKIYVNHQKKILSRRILWASEGLKRRLTLGGYDFLNFVYYWTSLQTYNYCHQKFTKRSR